MTLKIYLTITSFFFMIIICSCQHFNDVDNSISVKGKVVYADSSYLDVLKIIDVEAYVHRESSDGKIHYYSQEGMAVYNNFAFIFNEYGFCRLVDLYTKHVQNQIQLATFSSFNHANNACFSNVFYNEEDSFPLLYISPFNSPPTCYVERYIENSNSFELVQTIHIKTNKYNNYFTNFNLDNENSLLYVFFIYNYNSCVIRSYRLPNINVADVSLTDVDMVSEYKFNFTKSHIWQGSLYYNNTLYVLYGGELEKERGFYILDLSKQKVTDIDFSSKFASQEPEALSIYKHYLIVNTNGDGIYYLYHLKE